MQPARPPSPDAFAEAPLLTAAAAFAAGLALGRWWWLPPAWWLVAALVFVAAGLWLLDRRPWLARLVAHLALGAVAALLWQGQAASLHPPDLAALDGRRTLVTAHVIRDGTLRQPGTEAQRQVLEVETEQLQPLDEDTPLQLRTGLRLSLYGREASQDEDEPEEQAAAPRLLHYGERLRFPARLRLPRNFGNPGSFDYKEYLNERGIGALASARADQVERLPGFAGTRAGAWRSRIRAGLLDRIHRLWSSRQAALLDAMLIGERSFLDRDSRLAFQRSGVFHVLVVSGLNLGILAAFAFFALRLLRVPEIPATVVTVLLAAGYAALTDDQAPVWRATLMLAVYLAARLVYRERVPLNAIGTAALALLVYDPRALFGASFQLSFLSVIAIAGIAAPVLDRTSTPLRRALGQLDSTDYDLSLEPRLAQFRLDLRLIGERLGRLLGGRPQSEALCRRAVTAASGFCLRAYELVAVSVVMQLALALPMAIYFHRATTLAVPANVVAVPAAAIMLPAAALALGASYVATWLGKPFALIAGVALDALTGTVTRVGALGASDLRLADPGALTVVIAVAAVLAALFTVRLRRGLATAGLGALAAAALWIMLAPAHLQRRAGALEVTAIDVAQGDALLVVTADGHTLLVDAGGPQGLSHGELDYGEDVVSPYLWRRGITRLDAVALTHAHQDHIGGLAAVLRNFRPRELWLGAMPDVPAVRALLAEAAAAGARVRRPQSGEQFGFGDARIEVLAPPADWQTGRAPGNNDSLVLKISYGETAALLAGDAQRRMERMISTQSPAAQLLKVPHHGSNSSTGPELLTAVRPQWAVISAGWRNAFGHPRPEVLGRLRAAHVRTYRTDTMGAVSFYLDGRSVTPALPNRR